MSKNFNYDRALTRIEHLLDGKLSKEDRRRYEVHQHYYLKHIIHDLPITQQSISHLLKYDSYLEKKLRGEIE